MTEITGDGSVRSDAGILRRAFLVAAVVVGLFVLAVPVKYVVNDDPSFAMILSGSDGFSASADLPFLSRIFSQLLYSLYAVAPAVPWYGVCLYLSAFLGLGLLLTVPFATGFTRLGTVVMLVGWSPYLLFGLYNISMTSVTLWLQFGAILHVLGWLRSDRNWRLSGWLVGTALVVGYLWRWELFLVFSVFAAPLFLFVTRAELRKSLPVLIGLCLVVVCDRSWEYLETGTTEYQEYQVFNRVRGRFHDRAEGQWHASTPEALEKVGWTENDYLAYHDLWMLYDEDAVNERRLEVFLEANRRTQKGRVAQVAERVRQIVQGNKMVLPAFVLTSMALLVFYFPGWVKYGGSERWRMIGSVVAVGILAALVCYVRFVSRVSFPLFVYFMGLVVVIDNRVSRGGLRVKGFRGERVMVSVLSLAAIVLTTTWARVDASALRTEVVQRKFVRASVERFLEKVEDTPVLIQLDPGVAMMHVGCGPLTERLTTEDIRVVPTGWNMRSPRYQEALSEVDVRSGEGLLKRALEDPQFFFVLYARPWDDVSRVVSTWEAYYSQHFGEPGEQRYRLEPKQAYESAGYRVTFYQMVAE